MSSKNSTHVSQLGGTTRFGTTTLGADRTRQQTFHTQIPEDIDAFDALIDIPWNIYTVSKLFNFEPSEFKLRILNKKLREYVGITIDKTNEQYDEEIKTKITLENGFQINESDNIALRIEVNIIKTNKNNDKDVKVVLLYVGYLMSHGLEEYEEYSAQYPILISKSRGSSKVTNHVNEFLIKQFDCCIKKYVLDQTDMKWLFVTMLEVDDGIENDDQISLHYCIKKFDHKNEFEVTVVGDSMKKGWSACRFVPISERSYFENVDVKRLFDFLNKRILHLVGIDNNHCILLKTAFPNTEFHTDGQFTARTKETMEIIIRYLCQAISFKTNQAMKLFANFDKK